MNLSLRKKYTDLVESMLSSLMFGADPELETLLKPLRVYIQNIEDFTSQKVVDAKFRAFIKTRDEYMAELKQPPGANTDYEEIEKSQKAINKILDQVLGLLEKSLHSSNDVTGDVKEIMQKVYEAKTINSVRALSEAVLDLGEMMVSRNQDFRSGMSNLAVELSFCRNQIKDLETQLIESKREAEHDQLTGLRNRAVFDRDLEQALKRAQRFKNELCLLLVDIDSFRGINEKWGAGIGDDVLVNFGKLLERSLREFDLTYRLGGDEFGVIFHSCNLETADKVANRVRTFISSHVYRANKADFTMTLSGGLAAMEEGETMQSFFDRVHGLLQEAKENGGNTIKRG